MEPPVHRLGDLFRQLGLADRPAEIAAFLARHRPLPAKMLLADAPFWSPAQSRFLREGITDNADWAQVVSELDASLRDFASEPSSSRGHALQAAPTDERPAQPNA